MALGSLLLVCVVARVLGTARCSDGDQSECPCSGIPQWPLTEPPPEDCHQLNRTYRYTCLKGYLRTAGTSNLIKCKPGTSRWSSPTLKCKLDPRGGAAHASNSTDAGEHAVTASVEKHRNTSGPGYSLLNGSSNDTSFPLTGSSMTGSGITIAVVISIVIAALLGIGLLLHKMRKAQHSCPLHTTTEGIPLNEAT
ncbi:interleukin-15 receptor subunit alpha [Hippocampus zosterae]|uniref:interleukin-15 receptor subunit alpha n=1 Tax=Hippocampus zosterae TaxID=109293 RepID=UPI00223E272D|nr:interleukin-15 receptor subunit alpha [Hippocampus zosterae]